MFTIAVAYAVFGLTSLAILALLAVILHDAAFTSESIRRIERDLDLLRGYRRTYWTAKNAAVVFAWFVAGAYLFG